MDKKVDKKIYEIKPSIVKRKYKKKVGDLIHNIRHPINNFTNKHSLPLKPSEALSAYGDCLTKYEKREIFNYSNIYVCGVSAKKVKFINNEDKNYGFTNKNRYYKAIENDHLAFRFQILRVCGEGSYGQVLKTFDHKRRKTVAVKVLRRYNDKKNLEDNKELGMLQYLTNQDIKNKNYIVRFRGAFTFRNHICLILEHLHKNLRDVIRQYYFNGSDIHKLQKVTKDLLSALEYLSNLGVVHGDLKPENIMVTDEEISSIKLIDFGGAFFVDSPPLSFAQTLRYRCPELILNGSASLPMDIWSLGCIVAELISGNQLFTGIDERDQLNRMIEILDLPPVKIIESCAKKQRFFVQNDDLQCKKINESGTEEINNYVPINMNSSKYYSPGAKNLNSVIGFPKYKWSLRFIRMCLKWDPSERITTSFALHHPFITGNFD
uniref:dual-specificity kinase n=1 Tax=Parastrongyloides trichosuri TaxID=131310 RepID=A0A0N5A579_PARTI